MKAILEKNTSVSSTNKEKNLDVDFSLKEKLLPNENLVDDFSFFEQYNQERDECESYRLIFNVNPVCSNVLFNMKTEVVINEGSNECECLNFSNHGWDKASYAPNAINSKTPIKIDDAIRNTEYSNKENGNFVYHCGVDIFNNHMLRKKIFMHINKVNYSDKQQSYYEVYNTLADYLRDNNGNVIQEDLSVKYNITSEVDRHIYNTDSLYTLKNAFYYKCSEKDGWWGFTNPNMINTPTSSSNTISINNMLSKNKPCEFIDFYPDRSLFSFTPKFNKYRKRVEKNWEYCITYPYAKDIELLNTICGSENGEIATNFKVVTNAFGIRLLQCTSYFKHNLKTGDKVNIYYKMPEGGVIPDNDEIEYVTTFQKKPASVDVYSIGDLNGEHTDRIFSIKFDAIKGIFPFLSKFGLFYKKVSNSCECSYYFRIFKKITRSDGTNLRSDLNKAGLAENIYGDEISQIIFTDDLDIHGLKDENNRDLSEVFLTIIKTNKGHNLWYTETEQEHNSTSEDIEYSHCFGEITTGIDFGGIDINEEPFDYNVRYLHNLDKELCDTKEKGLTFSAWGETILAGMPKYIESGVSVDDDEFYGDIVEFDNYLYKTTTIAKICHRFNTAQREFFGNWFKNMLHDVIVSDDYEGINVDKYDTNGNITKTPFMVKQYYLNDVYSSMSTTTTQGDDLNLIYANICPEGYFYNPHNRVVLQEEGPVIHSTSVYVNYGDFDVHGREVIYIYKRTSEGDILIGKRFPEVDYGDGEGGSGGRAIDPGGNPEAEMVYNVPGIEGIILEIEVPTDYGFIKGDYVCIFDKITKETIWGEILSFKNMRMKLMFNDADFGGLSILAHPEYFQPNHLDRRFYAFWTENSVPLFAKFCLEANEFSWRNLMKPSQLDKNSDMFDTPFSNGRLYLENNINFFLKRQDPRGEYGLSHPLFKDIEQKIPNPIVKFLMDGTNGVDLTKYHTMLNNDINSCY